MRAMLLETLAAIPALEGAARSQWLAERPLRLAELPRPECGEGELRIRVEVCGICHTELDEIEGRTPPPNLPVVPGHEVVGRVDAVGAGVSPARLGERVGVGWIHHSCGGPLENVDPAFRATGRDVNGGYAEWMVVPASYAYPIPDVFTAEEAAPLLCAGAIGYRALRLANVMDGQPVGLMGFGGSAHLVLALLRHVCPASPVYVFARDAETRAFACSLGAHWAGDTEQAPPTPPAAIIDTTPAWLPVLASLAHLAPGGRLVINAIRKEDVDRAVLERLSYRDHLWMEKEIKSVANITGDDIAEFLPLAAAAGLRPTVRVYPLEEANAALWSLKHERVIGAKVLKVSA